MMGDSTSNLTMIALVYLAIMIPSGFGIECYDDSCLGTPHGRPCKSHSANFGPSDKKFNCQTGCKYWTIKDAQGRPVPGQPFKIRSCWDSYYDGHRYQDGKCTETHGDDGRVDRICVCAEDWCNGPEQDRMWDGMSSGSKFGNLNCFWTLGIVAYAYSKI